MKTITPSTFFQTHPVFRFDEFRHAYLIDGRRSEATVGAVLKQHVAAGNLINLRRGLYAHVPPGSDVKDFHVDVFLVASRATTDAVIAYHSALQMLGKAHSLTNRITYLTGHRTRTFAVGDVDIAPVFFPGVLARSKDSDDGIIEESRAGLTVRVTGYERTMVDMLASPQHGGGWEETWRSLENIEFVDLDFVVAYALRLKSALTVARLGFFLEQHRDELLVEDRHLEALRAKSPKHPTYFERRQRQGGRLVSHWNLFVPENIVTRSWGEVS